MKLNSMLAIFLSIYIIALIAENAYLFVSIASPHQETARALGQVQVCNNHPPLVGFNCSLNATQDVPYLCQLPSADLDGDNISYNVTFEGAPPFRVKNGLINYTFNATQVSNYTFDINATDNSVCVNNFDSAKYVLDVINVNDPCHLLKEIPNQTWAMDVQWSPFDVDAFFGDYDGDTLYYDYTRMQSIKVNIDPDNNWITFTPNKGFVGKEQIIIFGFDKWGANCTSNEFTLEVTGLPPPLQPPPKSTPSGASGGGGASGQPPICMPRWYCGPWGPCQPDNLMKRQCYDLNNCSSLFGRPNLTQECKYVHTCFDGILGPAEEQVDCGGVCPPCGSCTDELCNNKEDCTRGLIKTPDCGGPCRPCIYPKNETCFDSLCNNGEDCTRNVTKLPDCGGPCNACPNIENPVIVNAINWMLMFLILSAVVLSCYMAYRSYPFMVAWFKRKKRRYYEERLLLEARITESILESLVKLESMMDSQAIDKLIIMFSSLIRRYFKHLFDLKFEFTYEELTAEIMKRNISETFKHVLKAFFDRSQEIEFSGKSVTRDELKAMIAEFKEILALTSDEPLRSEEEAVKSHAKLTKSNSMFLKISEAEIALRKNDMNKAYFIYLRLVHDFNTLPEKDKKKLLAFITRLYEEIKLAREMFKPS